LLNGEIDKDCVTLGPGVLLGFNVAISIVDDRLWLNLRLIRCSRV